MFKTASVSSLTQEHRDSLSVLYSSLCSFCTVVSVIAVCESQKVPSSGVAATGTAAVYSAALLVLAAGNFESHYDDTVSGAGIASTGLASDQVSSGGVNKNRTKQERGGTN